MSVSSLDVSLPSYGSLDFLRPVVGVGWFKSSEPPLGGGGGFVFNVDTFVVGRKIGLWRSVLESGLLHSTSSDLEKKRLRAVLLLRDKAIYAFHNFRFDNKPLVLRWYQDLLLSDDHDRILFAAANQVGKSLTLDVDAATEFSFDHGKGWIGILVSKSLNQSQFQMDRIKQLLRSSNVSYREEDSLGVKTGKKDNSMHITYTFYDSEGVALYTNRLICCPPSGSALGYPADNLWLDEFDFWDNIDQNWFMQQVAIPRTIETHGKIKVFSNPNGRERELFKLWNETYSDGTPIWHRYNFNYWDKPGACKGQFDKVTARMSRFQVDSTMLARFSRSEGSFFSSEEIQDSISDELCEKGGSAGFGRETVWFLDVGSVCDQSVLVGAFVDYNEQLPEIPLIKVFWVHKYPQGYPIARVVGSENDYQGGDGWGSYESDNPSVKTVLERYSYEGYQPVFGFDATANYSMLPLFNNVGVEAADIVFSGRKKWMMYQRYQYYMQMRFLKRALDRDDNTVNNCDFSYQASKLVATKTVNGSYYKVHHEDESDLDDTQDAIAGLIWLVENPDFPSLSFEIINEEGVVTEEVLEVAKNLKDKISGGEVYIPSFYDKSELNDWVDSKIIDRT